MGRRETVEFSLFGYDWIAKVHIGSTCQHGDDPYAVVEMKLPDVRQAEEADEMLSVDDHESVIEKAIELAKARYSYWD